MRYKKIFMFLYFISLYDFVSASETRNKKPQVLTIERVEKHDKEHLFTELKKTGREQDTAIEECCFGFVLAAGGAAIVQFVLPHTDRQALVHCAIPACTCIMLGTALCCTRATQICESKMRVNAIAEELKRK